MSGNTSATGGYLRPLTAPPLTDQQLAVFIQAAVVGITGLPGSLVRPRWQKDPPTQPSPDTNWCAIGVTEHRALDFPYVIHDGDANNGNGVDIVARQEYLEVLASFYGPAAAYNGWLLRDGLYVPQNLEGLNQQGIKLIGSGTLAHTGELVNAQFIPRVDLPLTLAREIDTAFGIENLESAEIDFYADDGVTVDVIVNR